MATATKKLNPNQLRKIAEISYKAFRLQDQQHALVQELLEVTGEQQPENVQGGDPPDWATEFIMDGDDGDHRKRVAIRLNSLIAKFEAGEL